MIQPFIKNLIKDLDYYELLLLKKDIDNGSDNLRKVINDSVKEKLVEHQKNCVVCGKELNLYDIENYTLIFGREDFKKKASFCGIDCMEYFLTNLKEKKTQKLLSK